MLFQYALGQLAHFKLAPLPFCERITITTELLFPAGVVPRELEQLAAAEPRTMTQKLLYKMDAGLNLSSSARDGLRDKLE